MQKKKGGKQGNGVLKLILSGFTNLDSHLPCLQSGTKIVCVKPLRFVAAEMG